jgi:hypothetical protein
VGEAVAPGFDCFDFFWIDQQNDFTEAVISTENQKILRPFLHANVSASMKEVQQQGKEGHIASFTQFYDTSSELYQLRAAERM